VTRSATNHAVLGLEVGAGGLTARLGDGAPWHPDSPLDDASFLTALAAVRRLGTRPVPADAHGVALPAAVGVVAELRNHATAVGERLAALLSSAARDRLTEIEAAARSSVPALVQVRVAVADGGEPELADRLLALPWELLRLGGRFPVEEHTFDLVREAVVPYLPGLPEPEAALQVVATASAPVDQLAVDHEREMYRLWQALGARDEGRLAVADLGTLDELALTVRELVAKDKPPSVLHFTGHGLPGGLVFEDEAARSHVVAVDDLVRRLRTEEAPLPRLVYLSSCYGASIDERPGEAGSWAALTAQPSTAAALHRSGFAQVVGYFGPVGDDQATCLAATFYAALARGEKARLALRGARQRATRRVASGDGWTTYPLGWAQLALYHRGADLATAKPSATAAAPLEAPPKRQLVRLDRHGEARQPGRSFDGPAVGVQQLRHGFIGRRGPRSRAIRNWRDGQRLLVVQGLGGMGKTALCAELLRVLAEGRVVALDGRHAGERPDPLAALWQEVAAAREGDLAWSQTLSHLQKDGITGEALAGALDHLAGLEDGLVVYLDDAESLQAELGEGTGLGRWRSPELSGWWRRMVALTTGAGSFRLLASSRYRPEDTPDDALLHLGQMSAWEVVRLMSWMPTLCRLPHADREWLVGRLDGHPRTIEWLEALAAAAERRLAPPGGRFTGDWRERILEPILRQAGKQISSDLLLESVWRALDDEAREHLGRLSVATAPAPWGAVLALAPEASDGSGRRLADAGLLSPFESDEEMPWWRPHRLVSETVGRLWDGDAGAAHRLLGGFYRDAFAERATMLRAQRAVEHLCAGGAADDAFGAAEWLADELCDAGRYREGAVWIEHLLAAGPSPPVRGLSTMHHVRLRRFAGMLEPGDEERLLAARDLVEPSQRARVLFELGCFHQHQSRLPAARDHLEQAIVLETKARRRSRSKLASSLHELGCVLREQGEFAAARKRFERALAIREGFRGADGRRQVALTLVHLAAVLYEQKDWEDARSLVERSRAIQEEVFGTDRHPEVASSLHELARVLRAQGHLDDAFAHLDHALAIHRAVLQTETHPEITKSLHLQACVRRDQGDVAAAEALFREVLRHEGRLYPGLDHHSSAITEQTLGELLLDAGRTAEAGELLDHACQVFDRHLGPDHYRTRRVRSLLASIATD
jgi:tetratricopeptide (TPR) repeat protein